MVSMFSFTCMTSLLWKQDKSTPDNSALFNPGTQDKSASFSRQVSPILIVDVYKQFLIDFV